LKTRGTTTAGAAGAGDGLGGKHGGPAATKCTVNIVMIY